MGKRWSTNHYFTKLSTAPKVAPCSPHYIGPPLSVEMDTGVGHHQPGREAVVRKTFEIKT